MTSTWRTSLGQLGKPYLRATRRCAVLSFTAGSSRRSSPCSSRACLRSCSRLGSFGRGIGDAETVDIATSFLVPEVRVRQAERRRTARPFALLAIRWAQPCPRTGGCLPASSERIADLDGAAVRRRARDRTDCRAKREAPPEAKRMPAPRGHGGRRRDIAVYL